VLGIVLTAAYLLRAVSSVFFGEYDEHAWHDMKPSKPIDRFVMVLFIFCMVAIGMFPQVIAPIVESGMEPIMIRIQDAMVSTSNLSAADLAQGAAQSLAQILGGS
jgi:NADH:ubiquinone oxidoreductase subunit 4 (subunit M)